jgi:hypothetical protein
MKGPQVSPTNVAPGRYWITYPSADGPQTRKCLVLTVDHQLMVVFADDQWSARSDSQLLSLKYMSPDVVFHIEVPDQIEGSAIDRGDRHFRLADAH